MCFGTQSPWSLTPTHLLSTLSKVLDPQNSHPHLWDGASLPASTVCYFHKIIWIACHRPWEMGPSALWAQNPRLPFLLHKLLERAVRPRELQEASMESRQNPWYKNAGGLLEGWRVILQFRACFPSSPGIKSEILSKMHRPCASSDLTGNGSSRNEQCPYALGILSKGPRPGLAYSSSSLKIKLTENLCVFRAQTHFCPRLSE